METGLFELIAETVLCRKGLRSTTAAWLSGLLVFGFVVSVLGFLCWQFGTSN